MEQTRRLLGMRIKELRRSRGLSQEALSEGVGITAKYLSRVETGQHFPSLDVIVRLAEVLGVELRDVFEFTHAAPTQRELREALGALTKEAPEERLRLLVKVARALLR
jgi:transcriptional regulator with XRE-family HTH domain